MTLKYRYIFFPGITICILSVCIQTLAHIIHILYNTFYVVLNQNLMTRLGSHNARNQSIIKEFIIKITIVRI